MAAACGDQPPNSHLGLGPTSPLRRAATHRRAVHPDVQEAEDALRRAAVHAASGADRGREAEVARLHTGCGMSNYMECVRRCDPSRVGRTYSMYADLEEVTEVLRSKRDVERRRLGEKVLADVRSQRGAVRSAASREEGPRGGERRVRGCTPAPLLVSEEREVEIERGERRMREAAKSTQEC